MKIVLLCFIYAISWPAALYAQDSSAVTDLPQAEFVLPEVTDPGRPLVAPDQLETTRLYEGEEMTVRKFDDRKWKEIVADVEYNETPRKEQKPEKESGSSSGLSMPWASGVLRLVSYVVIAAVILALVYLVVKNISFDLKIRRTEVKTTDLEQPVEDIEAFDIESLLERARREGNLRLVVRLCYLELLKRLNQRGVIRWKKDKTNRDYLSELFSSDFYFDDIRRLTLSYEAVWYGDHDLRPEAYRDLTDRFESMYEKINIGISE